jgi:hypothetical protein
MPENHYTTTLFVPCGQGGVFCVGNFEDQKLYRPPYLRTCTDIGHRAGVDVYGRVMLHQQLRAFDPVVPTYFRRICIFGGSIGLVSTGKAGGW